MTSSQRPVLLVHGIWDTERRIEPLRAGLSAHGLARVRAFSLRPNDGRAPLEALAEQVRVQATALLLEGPDFDLVGFSMGALIARYYVQRLGGRAHVRRFVSISGPHRGTLTAHLGWGAGARQMRPGSAFLQDLERDSDPFGPVEVHCLYTPMDLMILPADSSVLAGAASTHRLRIPLHRLMIHAPRVHALVAKLLLAEA